MLYHAFNILRPSRVRTGITSEALSDIKLKIHREEHFLYFPAHCIATQMAYQVVEYNCSAEGRSRDWLLY